RGRRAYDAIWPGLLRPGVDPATRREMATHLLPVHLPLYIGVAAVLVTTLWAFIEALRDGRAGGAWWAAAFGALLSAVGETWHAGMHLQLDAHARAAAGSLSPGGLILVARGLFPAPRP